MSALPLSGAAAIPFMPGPSPRKRSSRRPRAAARLAQSLNDSPRAALWDHRGSLDRLRDAICAFTRDLSAKGMNASDIAAAVREAVLELRAAGVPLAAELATADPSLDQTVAWCLGFGDSKNPLPHEDTGVNDRSTNPADSTNAPLVHERRRGPDRRKPPRLRGP